MQSQLFQVLPPMHIARWVFGLVVRAPATTARTTPSIPQRCQATQQSWTTESRDTNHHLATASSPHQPFAGRETRPRPSAQTRQLPFANTTAHVFPIQREQLRAQAMPWQTMQGGRGRAHQLLVAATHRYTDNCQTESPFVCRPLPKPLLQLQRQLPLIRRADSPIGESPKSTTPKTNRPPRSPTTSRANRFASLPAA